MKQRKLFGIFVFVTLVVSMLACSFSLGDNPTATPGSQAAATNTLPTSCMIPDLAGKDRAAAENAVKALGAVPTVQLVESSTVDVGMVVSTDPAKGQASPCPKSVTINVSSGPASKPTASLPTKAPTTAPTKESGLNKPTATAESTGIEEKPMEVATYYEGFPDRVNGLDPAWTTNLTSGTADTFQGLLQVKGKLAASYNLDAWSDFDLTFGNATFPEDMETFNVIFRMQDDANYMTMKCTMKPSAKGIGSFLNCIFSKIVNDGEVPMPDVNPIPELCTGLCTIDIKGVGNEFTVSANGAEKASFTDDSFAGGGIGFSVKSVKSYWSLDYLNVVEPAKPASGAFTLYREDFETNQWDLKPYSGERVSTTKTLGNHVLTVKGTSKQDVTYHLTNPNDVPQPDEFTLYSHLKIVDGPTDFCAGVSFRHQTKNEDYYIVSVCQDGKFALFSNISGKWNAIIDDTPTSAIVQGDVNQVKVVGQGAHYWIYINSELVGEADDSSLQGGTFSLTMEFTGANQKATVEYDDLVLFVP